LTVKSAEHQASALRTHKCFVGQRTQLINALRGHLAEFEFIVAQGSANLKSVFGMLVDENVDLPGAIAGIYMNYMDQIELLTQKIDGVTLRLREAIKDNDDMRRLCSVPGVGSITAGAIMAFAPDLQTFSSGRNFAAWLGPVSRQQSRGEKTRLGSIRKIGQADIRKLLIVGAVSRIRWIVRKGVLPDNWLCRDLGRSQPWRWPTKWRVSSGDDDKGSMLPDDMIRRPSTQGTR
jgi:transposase